MHKLQDIQSKGKEIQRGSRSRIQGLSNPPSSNENPTGRSQRNGETSNNNRESSNIRIGVPKERDKWHRSPRVEGSATPGPSLRDTTIRASRRANRAPQLNENLTPEETREAIDQNGINFIQINLHNSSKATNLLNYNLSEKKINIAMVQDVYINKYTGRPDGLGKIWSVATTKSNKAAIIMNIGTIPIQTYQSENIIAVRIQNKDQDITLINLYIPPSTDIKIILQELGEIVQASGKDILIAGDFNAHATLWGYGSVDSRGNRMMDFLVAHGLCTINDPNSLPTFQTNRSHGWPDLTIASPMIARNIHNWTVLNEETLSDHRYITYNLNFLNTDYNRHHLETKLGKHQKFRRLVKNIYRNIKQNLQNMNTPDHIENVIQELLKEIQQAAESCYRRRKTPKPLTPTWFTKQLKIHRNKVRAHRKQYQREINPEEKTKKLIVYKKERAKFKRMIREAKSNTWKKYCTGTKEAFGTQFKYFRNKNLTMTPLANVTDMQTPDIINILESFLDNLYITDPTFPHTLPPPKQIRTPIPNTSPQEVNRIIRAIKKNKAPGEDGIDYNLIKHIHEQTPYLIPILINKCLKQQYFPKCFKSAIVVLFHKTGKERTDPKNYRPISLLPALSKIYERILHGRYMHHLHNNIDLHPHQYGFRHGTSTEHAIANIFKIVEEDKREGKLTMLVCFDIKGAFDSIPWQPLIEQLQKKETPDYLNNVIKSYLSNRIVKLSQNGITVQRNVYGGCPQGSCLGPLLWDVLADDALDIPWNTHTCPQAFADDFEMTVSGYTTQEIINNCNETIETFARWTEKHHLTINWTKTQLLYINRPVMYNFNIPVDAHVTGIKYRNIDLIPGDTMKYLGVVINNKGNWNDHCLYLRDKTHEAYKTLSLMATNNWGVSSNFIKTWYYVVIEKILTYAAPIWGHNLKRQEIKILQSAQRPFLLAITKGYKTSPTSALQVLAGIPPIHLTIEKEAKLGSVTRLRKIVNYREQRHYPDTYENKINIWTLNPTTLAKINHGIHTTGIQIYTDGSKMETGTGAAFVAFEGSTIIHIHQVSLHQNNSVFQAELIAILEALKWAQQTTGFITIHTDSESAIKALNKPFNTNPLIINILKILYSCSHRVSFNWVKAHVGILGNEAADRAAKEAAENPQIFITYVQSLPISHLKRTLFNQLMQNWQREWDTGEKGRTTYDYFSKVSTDMSSSNGRLTQFFTGHGPFPSYLHRFKRAVEPDCPCGAEGTSLHYLFDCELSNKYHIKKPSQANLKVWQSKVGKTKHTHKKIEELIQWLHTRIDDFITKVPQITNQ